ncbi:hypothetical protein HMPREF1246_0030 [Acidaminococcus sp. BV3L6]|nr:hypothetical protein HMPREF1246_0030 [Acidaminococcus sp. BV3L6]
MVTIEKQEQPCCAVASMLLWNRQILVKRSFFRFFYFSDVSLSVPS